MADFSGGTAGAGAVSLLSTTTASATTATFPFSAISVAFTSLRLVGLVRSDNPATSALVQLQFNGDNSAVYDSITTFTSSSGVLQSSGLAVTAARIVACPGTASPATEAALFDLVIPNYNGTTYQRMWAGVGGNKQADSATNVQQENMFGAWRTAAAVTAVTVLVRGQTGTAQNFLAGSIVSLYGIT